MFENLQRQVAFKAMSKPLSQNTNSTSPAGPEFARWLERIRSANQSALGDVYDATVCRVYALALRITGNTRDAEEVTRDVYCHLWRNPPLFDSDDHSLLHWLMAIARGRALTYCRKRLIQQQVSNAAADVDGRDMSALSDAASNPCEEGHIPNLLSHLTSMQFRIVGLAFCDGLSHREISECTGMPVAAVRSHLCLALLALRKALIGVGHFAERVDGPSEASSAQYRGFERS